VQLGGAGGEDRLTPPPLLPMMPLRNTDKATPREPRLGTAGRAR